VATTGASRSSVNPTAHGTRSLCRSSRPRDDASPDRRPPAM
jgi:hypothetical protein